MPFPPPPKTSIDWASLGFAHSPVDGHIETHYNKKVGKWTPLKFIRDPYLRIHGMATGLNYGQQAFEGMKAFRTPEDQITLFRPQMNCARLAHSAEVLSIPPVPDSIFMEAVQAAVSLNAAYVPPHHTAASLYIRPVVFGTSPQLTLSPPDDYTFCVFVAPVGVYHGVHPLKALIMEDFDRAAPNGTGHAKIGGNYAPVMKHSDAARAKGYEITLHLDSQTRTEIDEFSTSGFIGVKDAEGKITLAVPDSKSVIASVTSNSCLDIGESLGYTIERRSIKYEELSDFSEVLAAGTAAALVPIKSIARESSSDSYQYIPKDSEDPGPVYTKLISTLQGIQLGKIKDTFGWCVPVTEVDIEKYT